MPAQVTLSRTDQVRLARLAREANKTPHEVLRFILDNGLSTAAHILDIVADSRAAATRGEVASHAVAMRRVRATIERNAGRTKKTA